MNDGLISLDFVNNLIGRRKKDIHKGNCGRVLLIAGSYGMAGAAVLAGQGALRSGAGLVTMAVPEELFNIVQIAVPEATCVRRSLPACTNTKYDALGIGPGIGKEEVNGILLREIFLGYKGKIVLDADGLNSVVEWKLFRELKNAACEVVITPHIGEAARILGEDVKLCSSMDRQLLAEKLVDKTGAVVVLKGAGTIVANSDKISYTNTTGNPGMATGGSGDVLTGVITSLMGQGLNSFDAACAGVFIHGMAGDIGAEKYGEYGLTAGDIARYCGVALQRITA